MYSCREQDGLRGRAEGAGQGQLSGAATEGEVRTVRGRGVRAGAEGEDVCLRALPLQSQRRIRQGGDDGPNAGQRRDSELQMVARGPQPSGEEVRRAGAGEDRDPDAAQGTPRPPGRCQGPACAPPQRDCAPLQAAREGPDWAPAQAQRQAQGAHLLPDDGGLGARGPAAGAGPAVHHRPRHVERNEPGREAGLLPVLHPVLLRLRSGRSDGRPRRPAGDALRILRQPCCLRRHPAVPAAPCRPGRPSLRRCPAPSCRRARPGHRSKEHIKPPF
mmetsp:Transcript_15836/g.61882  ORF Transcript_15836/g.61882 Transcript_15836/m.61882 type:complete len:274 (+) Transcript_15836:419-1240(+)